MTEGDPDAGGFADRLDNDCSGEVDEPYQDRDGDGWTEAEGDCWDDMNDIRSALVYPGAEELCDDFLDNDVTASTTTTARIQGDMLRFKAGEFAVCFPPVDWMVETQLSQSWESWPYWWG